MRRKSAAGVAILSAILLCCCLAPSSFSVRVPDGILPIDVEPLPLNKDFSAEVASLYDGGLKSVAAAVVGLRRAIHEKPGVMYEEYDAAEIAYNTLRAIGVDESNIKTRLGVTGLVAHIGAGTLESSMRGEVPTLVLRADMDALPIMESKDNPDTRSFASRNDGVMHACGHDTHTAMLLGAAKLLKPFERALASEGKTVRFAFQPSEEGGAGGKMMVDEGLLDGASASFALHTSSRDRTGLIVGKHGAMNAAAGFFTFVIRGKGGHAAAPHTAIDPVNTAAQVVLSLNTIVGRMVDNPNSPVVRSIPDA